MTMTKTLVVGAAEVPASDALSATGDRVADLRGQISWALFEFARSPYLSLVYIYVFAPYFTTVVVGDPVRGQELWSSANTVVGIVVALLAPLIGAMSDRMGRRKPWIAAVALLMSPACIALWWSMPGAQGGLSIHTILLLIVILASGFMCGEVFHNSMLPSIASPRRVGVLSGIGLAVGNSGSLVALVVVLFGIALPASDVVSWTFLPDQPWFGLDPQRHEHERIAGPIAGVWLLLFHLPLLLWTPDRRSTGVSIGRAVGEGLNQLWFTIKQARRLSNVGVYLLARMLYTDGKVAIIAYAGIYGSGVYHWDVAELVLFGLLLTPPGIVGGLLGGWLDNKIGSKRAIQIAVSGIVVSMIGIISTTPQEIFFVFPYDPTVTVWSFAYFRTLPELLYVVMFIVLVAFIGAAFANSRAMLARIAPASMMSQFFGLYALSGTATAFFGHGLVALFTHTFNSQRAGFASTIILLVSGLIIMQFVREERAKELPL